MANTISDVNASAIIRGENLVKQFRKRVVLNDVSFHISEGSYHAIAGENGSGKTTLVKMIIGAYPNSSYRGRIICDLASVGLSYTPESVNFPSNWNVEQYLYQIAFLLVNEKNAAMLRVTNALKEMDIYELRKQKPRSLSSGQKKKVMLAKVAIEMPRVIIMDEPSANLDYTTRQFLNKKLAEYNAKGVTIIIISHLVKEIETYVNEVTILHYGKMLLNTSIEAGTLSKVYEKSLASLGISATAGSVN